VAGNADQQSNGANQYGNGQEIDQPTGIGYAMQWKRSNEDYDQSQCDSLNPEASGVHENFAPEVKISGETGDKTFLETSGDENSGDGNYGTGRGPANPTGNSGSRTGDDKENDVSGAAQQRQQGQLRLHPNVTQRQHRKHRYHEHKSPRKLIRAASREAAPYARNDGGRSTTAQFHNNDAAGQATIEGHGGLRPSNVYDPTGHSHNAEHRFQQQHDPNLYAAWGNDTGRPPQQSRLYPTSTLPGGPGDDRSMGAHPMQGHFYDPVVGQPYTYSTQQKVEMLPIGAQQPVQPVWVDTSQWQMFNDARSPSRSAESANDASWRFLGATAQTLLEKMEREQGTGAEAAGAAAQAQAE